MTAFISAAIVISSAATVYSQRKSAKEVVASSLIS